MDKFISLVKQAWKWVKKLPKKVTIPVAIIIVALLSFGGYQSIHFYNYMQHNPEFCYSCHLMEKPWDRWESSEHSQVECHGCHQQSIFAGANQIISFALGNPERVEAHATVQDETCEDCHESGSPEWIQVAQTAGHQEHAEVQNIACTKCHSITVHRFEAPGTICSVCHEEKHIDVNGMAKMHCTACHQFLAEGEHPLPTRSGCLDCHQALTAFKYPWPVDAPMQFACGECHQPHHEPGERLVGCQSCHTTGGMHLKPAHDASTCTVCHGPHEWQVTRRETCLLCHPASTEHYADTLCNDCHQFS